MPARNLDVFTAEVLHELRHGSLGFNRTLLKVVFLLMDASHGRQTEAQGA